MIDFQKAYHRMWDHYNSIVPFSQEEFDMVVKRGELRTVRKGDLVYKQGRIPAYGAYIYHGALRQFHTDSKTGVETTVGFEFEGSCIGDLRSIFYQEPTCTSLQALEDTVLGTLSKEHYPYLVDHCKPFAKMMLLSMEQRYNAIVGETVRNRTEEAEEAYLKMLTDFPQILPRVPQHYIASYLGIKPQSLSRIRKNISKSQAQKQVA